MSDNRVIYRTTRAQVALDALQSELQAEYDGALWGMMWHAAAQGGQGDLEIYFAPDTNIQAAMQIVQTHNPSTAWQANAQRRQNWHIARGHLPQLAQDLDADWSVTPPPDALEKLRAAVLDVIRLTQGLD